MSDANRDAGTMDGIDTPADETKAGDDLSDTDWDPAAFDIAHIGGNEYRVLSTRNSSVTHYKVDVAEGTCACSDQEYNLSQHEACPHLTKALMVHSSHRDASEWALQDINVLRDRANNLTHELRETTDWVKTVMESEAAGAASESIQDGETTETPDGTTVETVSAAEAAEDLQAAFDDVLTDMQVEYNEGIVWFQTGRETEEEWPYPGGSEVFKVITSPDSVMYVHDGSDEWADSPHEHFDSKPGQYFKNALEPEDVEDYISEVLE